MYDVMIIGGGPAGLSAAINVRQRGKTALVICTPIENNPLWKAERIDNYPGMYGKSGKEMLMAMTEHAKEMGVSFADERVLNAFYNNGSWMVSAGAQIYEGTKLIFAGGVIRGKKFEGEEKLVGRGVSYCATCDGMLYRGRKVVVIGFGEGDRKEADYLKEIGCLVTYLEKPGKVQLKGTDQLEAVTADGTQHEAECAFILRPSVSPLELFPGIETDGRYILVDRSMRTNLPGLFAAGDCTGAPLQVAKAVGEGMIAGQTAAKEK